MPCPNMLISSGHAEPTIEPAHVPISPTPVLPPSVIEPDILPHVCPSHTNVPTPSLNLRSSIQKRTAVASEGSPPLSLRRSARVGKPPERLDLVRRGDEMHRVVYANTYRVALWGRDQRIMLNCSRSTCMLSLWVEYSCWSHFRVFVSICNTWQLWTRWWKNLAPRTGNPNCYW